MSTSTAPPVPLFTSLHWKCVFKPSTQAQDNLVSQLTSGLTASLAAIRNDEEQHGLVVREIVAFVAYFYEFELNPRLVGSNRKIVEEFADATGTAAIAAGLDKEFRVIIMGIIIWLTEYMGRRGDPSLTRALVNPIHHTEEDIAYFDFVEQVDQQYPMFPTTEPTFKERLTYLAIMLGATKEVERHGIDKMRYVQEKLAQYGILGIQFDTASYVIPHHKPEIVFSTSSTI